LNIDISGHCLSILEAKEAEAKAKADKERKAKLQK